MKLKDITSKGWLDVWLIAIIIFTTICIADALFLGYLWGLSYIGFLVGFMVRINYMKTDIFGPFEMLISTVFWVIWDFAIFILFVVPEMYRFAYFPNPQAIPVMISYLGSIMCPILAGLLRQRFKKRD